VVLVICITAVAGGESLKLLFVAGETGGFAH
jgi:hypothetical protein